MTECKNPAPLNVNVTYSFDSLLELAATLEASAQRHLERARNLKALGKRKKDAHDDTVRASAVLHVASMLRRSRIQRPELEVQQLSDDVLQEVWPECTPDEAQARFDSLCQLLKEGC